MTNLSDDHADISKAIVRTKRSTIWLTLGSLLVSAVAIHVIVGQGNWRASWGGVGLGICLVVVAVAWTDYRRLRRYLK